MPKIMGPATYMNPHSPGVAGPPPGLTLAPPYLTKEVDMDTSLITEIKKDLKDAVYGTPLVQRLLRPNLRMRNLSVQEVIDIRKRINERLDSMGWRHEKK